MLSIEEIVKYLESPERPSEEELRLQVKGYLSSLSSKELETLIASESPKADYTAALEFLRLVGFTALEASWYAGVGLDNPKVRRLVARRALALKRLGRPYTATAYDLIALEDRMLRGLSFEQMLEELKDA